MVWKRIFIWGIPIEETQAHAKGENRLYPWTVEPPRGGTGAPVVFTQSGSTARLISKRRPRTPLVAFTPHEHVWRQLCLCWGTQPRLMDLVEDTGRMVAEVEARLMVEGGVEVGDTLVLLSSAPVTARAETNMLK